MCVCVCVCVCVCEVTDDNTTVDKMCGIYGLMCTINI